MAHAIWHIEPSYYKDWWKDRVGNFADSYKKELDIRKQPGWRPQPSVQQDINKFLIDKARGLGGAIQSGALSVQENVIDPTLDRVMGTAPGIPARPFFRGETGVPPRQHTRPSIPAGSQSVADIVNNFKTPASLGFTMPPSAPVPGPQTVPISPATADKSLLDYIVPAAQAAGYPTKTVPNTDTDTTAVQDWTREQLINLNAGLPAKASDAVVEAATVTPPQGTPREAAMHGRLTEPSIMERPGVKEFLGREEDDELGGMLKMMFISDLIRGSAADTPSYPRAVSVGPASRDFVPLPSWRWR